MLSLTRFILLNQPRVRASVVRVLHIATDKAEANSSCGFLMTVGPVDGSVGTADL